MWKCNETTFYFALIYVLKNNLSSCDQLWCNNTVIGIGFAAVPVVAMQSNPTKA